MWRCLIVEDFKDLIRKICLYITVAIGLTNGINVWM